MTVIQYYRPGTLEDALARLNQKELVSVPLGGGTGLNRYGKQEIGVVDLQLLGLNEINHEGASIKIGAAATLQFLLDSPTIPLALKKAIELEATYNQRQMATIAGRLVTADGRSPLAAALLAMDASLTWEPGNIRIGLGDWLPLRQSNRSLDSHRAGVLMTSVNWPARMSVAFHYVSRTPLDRPIICVGAAGWSSGRRRIAVGGYGPSPLLAMDGPEPGGTEEAVKDIFSQAGDEWASAEYRQETAVILTRRCMQDLEGIEE